jgi:hypothetical protein
MCDQMSHYLVLEAEHGPQRAKEIALRGMPERQAARMGSLLERGSLADGMSLAIPGLDAIGISTEFFDASSDEEDVAVEVMLTCSCLLAARTLGLSDARPVVCDLDLTATERAFPGLHTRVLARQTDGKKVCAFRFSRTRRSERTDETALQQKDDR